MIDGTKNYNTWIIVLANKSSKASTVKLTFFPSSLLLYSIAEWRFVRMNLDATLGDDIPKYCQRILLFWNPEYD